MSDSNMGPSRHEKRTWHGRLTPRKVGSAMAMLVLILLVPVLLLQAGHGGKIWVESQPGQGATFYFTLPEKGAYS